MGFLVPSTLFYMALGALPIIIYLIHRQRYRRVRWAAMDFLVQALRKQRRRLRLEDLLLLIIRVAVLLLAALALARPVWQGQAAALIGGLDRPARNVVLLIDRSYSMAHAPGAHSAFERARGLALDILERRLTRSDRALLAFFDEGLQAVTDRPVFLDEEGLRQLKTQLLDAGPGERGTDLPAALERAVQLLSRFAPEGTAAQEKLDLPRDLVVLTDFTARGWGPPERADLGPLSRRYQELAAHGVRLHFVDVGLGQGGAVDNISVEALEPPDRILGVGETAYFRVRLRNHGDSAQKALQLVPRLDDERLPTLPVAIEPQALIEVQVPVRCESPGTHALSVELNSDALRIDNRRHAALVAHQEVAILLVDGQTGAERWSSETDFLVVALESAGEGADTGPLRPKVSEGLEDALERYALVVLANLAAPPEPQAQVLERYLRDGGRLLILLGDQVDPEAWNRLFYRADPEASGLLPLRLGELRGDKDRQRAVGLKLLRPEHPALAEFRDAKYRADLEGIKTFQYLALESPVAGSRADVLAALGDEAATPWLVEQRVGRGHVLLVNSTADAAWSNLPASWCYQVLMSDLVHHLVTRGGEARHLALGEAFQLEVPAALYASDVRLLTPAGESLPKKLLEIEGRRDRFLLEHKATDSAGIYRITMQREGAPPHGDAFAVNVDPAEGDLRRIAEEDLRARLPSVPIECYRHDRSQALFAAQAQRGAAGELWRRAILLVLILLGLETALALLFGRRR